ncbi:Myb-like DNA-binding protein REB1 [Microdochium nivale]|nr:Myb-like DNA-binding protein REB1 [Microdochium nivale]
MGQNSSQPAPLDSEQPDPDRHDQSERLSDVNGDIENDSVGNHHARSPSAASDNDQKQPLHIAFSSQIPGATQNLDAGLRFPIAKSKRAKAFRVEIPSSSPRRLSKSHARKEIAESPERFIPPSPRANSPELNVSPTRARAIEAEASDDQVDNAALDSSSQVFQGDESPEARRQRKLARKEERERKKSRKLAQAATAMADTTFDNHGLDALTTMDNDNQALPYQLSGSMSDEVPVVSDILPPAKSSKKRKSKKGKIVESAPQHEQQLASDGDLDQLVAFTNSSFPTETPVTTDVVESDELTPAPASKKRRKSNNEEEAEKKKKKARSQHGEFEPEVEEQYLLSQPGDETLPTSLDQAMEDVITSPKPSKKKRKTKLNQPDAPLPEAEQLQVEPSFLNGTDHGLVYGGHGETPSEIPSYQPESTSPYNPGHMSLDEIARAISSGHIQSQYGASNIPIDPELAKYESTQDLLASQHYAPDVSMHGLDVPLDNQHMHMQYTNYEEQPLDIPQMEPEVPITPVPQNTKAAKSSGRKRIAKPDFYSRVQEDFAELPSPSAAGMPPPADDLDQSQTNGQPPVAAKTEDFPDATPDTSRPAMRVPRNGNVLTGPFSDFELHNITQAIENWRVENNMTQYDINAFIHGNPKDVNSSEFWNRVINTCPNRRRQKVINQCRRKFHNFVARGTWTPEQHDELSKMWELHGNKYTLIGSLINRHPEDVRDRIRNYVVCGDSRRKDAWSQEEEDRLANIVAEAIDAIRRMREKQGDNGPTPDEEMVDWQLVSEKMERTRSRLQCITKWKLIKAQLEGGGLDGEVLTLEQIIDKARREAESMTDRDRYNVVKAIKSCGAQADSRIPWAKVRAERVGDKWSRATLMLVWHRLKVTVPEWKIQSVSSISEYLCNSYSETNKLQFPSSEILDLDNEYEEIERKVSKIIKAHNRPKTSAHLVDQEDLDDDVVGAMDVSQLPLDEDGKPMNNGRHEDLTDTIASQLEEPKTEDESMEQALGGQQDATDAVVTSHDEEEAEMHDDFAAANGHHAPGAFEDADAQQENGMQFSTGISDELALPENAEDVENGVFERFKTPKPKKPYGSKKTPSTAQSDQAASSRRPAKKTGSSRRGKKADAMTAGDDDVNGGASSSSGSDEDIPARV